MIIYGIITETSIGQLFIAGIVPGLMISAMMVLYTTVVSKLNPSLAPRAEGVSWKERFTALSRVWAIALLFLAVIGSIYLGIATPAESAAIGAFGALLLTLIYRQLTWKRLFDALSRSAQVTAMVMFLLVGGFSLSFVVASLGIAHSLTDFLLSLGVNRWGVMIGFNVLLILLGFILEPASIIVITMPLLFPVFMSMGFDPVWLGVIVTVNAEIGMITPPVGLNLFVLKGVIPSGVSMNDVILGSLPYVLVLIAGLALLMAFPEIALWLPSTMTPR